MADGFIADENAFVTCNAKANTPSEAEISKRLELKLTSLTGRVRFWKEVRMLCFTHASRGKADTLRIDYVVEFDGGPLVGVEVKAAMLQAADLGRALFQCAQYSAGIIGGATADRIPIVFQGRPLAAVLLCTDRRNSPFNITEHMRHADRLFGPANVGFLTTEPRGLCARLCSERYWTEWSGWHRGMLDKNIRCGNGSFKSGLPK